MQSLSHRDFMRRAVDLGKQCVDEHSDRPSPRVGVVVSRDGQILAEAYRGQSAPGDHAEYIALERHLAGIDLAGTTVYTTLEPCTSRSPKKTPCAKWLAERHVAEVVIGIYDPDPRVNRKGWKHLRDARIKLRDFPADLREEIRGDNHAFLSRFEVREAMSGSNVCFDYTKNSGRFRLGVGDHAVETRWSAAGHDSIYAIDDNHHVALARYAQSFEEIDDPSAQDFSSRHVHAHRGEVVVFRNQRGDHALVQVGEVLAGSDYEDDRFALCFDYEIRIAGS